MRVMSIGAKFVGANGPPIPYGATLRVKHTIEDRGEMMYEFKEIPNWAYSVKGFIPLSNKCEVKILRRRKKQPFLKRLSKQLTIGFKLL